MSLDEARAALERGEFRRALDGLAGLPGAPTSAEHLEVRAAAAYGAGEFETAVSAWEALYTVHADAGRVEDAAWAAATVALNLLVETGMLAPVRGWARRAERLVEHEPIGRVHALLAMVRTYERLLSGDPQAARGHAHEAVELGTTFDVGPARGLGQIALARLMISEGQLERGVEMLDEVAVSLKSGEFDPITTGNMYCELICAAQWVSLVDRARDWTDVMERWRHGPAYGAIHGRCRVHRAELLRLSGPADEAEAEALHACAELRPWMRREYGWPLVELGAIRLRRGDFAGAEEAFLLAHELAWSPQPGLALLRMEQGDVAGATAMITSAITHPVDVPWKERPPFGDLRLAPLLAARSQIAEAAADRAGAVEAATMLREIVERYPSPWLLAEAELGTARAALLEGSPGLAVRAAGAAAAVWTDLDAPYDAAVARVVLGSAHASSGHTAAARMEWESACAAFGAFGAVHKERAVAALLSGSGAAPPPSSAGRPAPEVAVLRRTGTHWQVAFREAQVVLPDLKGIRYLERLLADAGREFHVLDLVAAEVTELGLPVLDEEAKAAYRRRLTEVEQDIDEASAEHDTVRREHAERDREYLLVELRRAVGLGGRSRTSGGTVERARTSVTRSLRYALARLAKEQPDLGSHLSGAVRTGVFCSYQPDPVAPVRWHLE